MRQDPENNWAPAPNPNFDATDPVRRRAYIRDWLVHARVWHQDLWKDTCKAAQDQLCVGLHQAGREWVRADFFDFVVDSIAWEDYLKQRGLPVDVYPWPWGDETPEPFGETGELSETYKAWREAEANSASDPKDPKDPKGVKPQAKPTTSQATGKPLKPAQQQGGPSNSRGPQTLRPARQQGGSSKSRGPQTPKPARQPGGPSTSRGPKPPKTAQQQGGSSVAPRVPPKPVSGPRATSSGAVRKPTAQPAPAPQVAESSDAALAKARAEKKPMKVPPHLAHKFGDNANSKAEPTHDEAHEAALAAARVAANQAKVGEIASAFKGFTLEDEIEKEAMDKAKKEEEAKWKDLEDKSLVRFHARLATLREDGVLAYGQSGSATVSWDEKLPLRQAYRPAFKVGRIPPPCPDLKLRQQIWDILDFESPAGPFLGPFELALPQWVDFFDLVLGKDGELFNGVQLFVPRDVAIAWTKNEDGLPKSLVVGPHPGLCHSAETGPLRRAVREVWFQVVAWATEVYLARPLRLPHYLKCHETLVERSSVVLTKKTMDDLCHVWNNVPNFDDDLLAFFEARKENLIRWVPEIHAILKVPEKRVEIVLQEWVLEGHETEASLRERIDAVVDHWSESSPVQARRWQKLVEVAIFNDE